MTTTDRERREALLNEIRQQGGELNPCACMGPQDGEPLCPCLMKQVTVRDGRYVLPERDIGAVRAAAAMAGEGE